jgi:predicted nucleic acid-binding protein
VRFWDSSAIISLAIAEDTSSEVRKIIRDDDRVLVWILSEIEITAALWRRVRSGDLEEKQRAPSQRAFDQFLAGAIVVNDFAPVMSRGRRILATHLLRSGDALQLAAALFACDDQPAMLPIVTLDTRLAEAATREGFEVLPH